MSAVLWPAFEQLEALAGVSAASALTGIPRSSVYRWRAADRRPFGPPRAPAPKVMPSALTEAERADVLAVLDSDRFADKAPAQALITDATYSLGGHDLALTRRLTSDTAQLADFGNWMLPLLATGLTSDTIYVLGEDAAGRLYVGTGIGVDIIDGAEIVHVSKADGLVGDDCAAGSFHADPDGTVWEMVRAKVYLIA